MLSLPDKEVTIMDAASIRANFEARSHAAQELRALYDDAAGREMTAEERSKEESISTAIADYDARIEAGLKAAEAEKRSAEAFEAAGLDLKPRQEERQSEPSDYDRLRSLVSGEVRSVEFAPTSWEERNQNKLTAAAGGNTVPTSFYDTLIESMIDVSSVLAANATVIRTSGGEKIQVPTATAYPQAALVTETAQLPNQAATFGQVDLDAFKYGFTMRASSELLADNAVNIVEFMGRRGGEALGNGIGAAYINGTGTNQPRGILAATGGLTTTASAAGSVAAGFRYDDVIDLVHSVLRPYRTGSVFICNDSVIRTLRRLREGAGTGQYLWQPSLTAGAPDTLAGYPILSDPAMPTAQTNGTRGLVFGNIEKAVIVRFAGPVRVESSTDFAFDTDLTTWRFIVRTDSEVVDPNAARALTYTT